MAKATLSSSPAKSNFIDITGQSFGRLVVLERAENCQGGKARWLCRCNCGASKIVVGVDLRNGHTGSCGCLMQEINARLHYKHGKRRTSEYSIWCNMKRRCFDPTNKYYADYGGRGISVSSEWLSDFEKFLTDMGPRPSPKHSIERIDNNDGYHKDNCKWATPKEQGLNRRNTATIVYNGKSTPVSIVAVQNGLKPFTLKARLKRGFSLDKALLPIAELRALRYLRGTEHDLTNH